MQRSRFPAKFGNNLINWKAKDSAQLLFQHIYDFSLCKKIRKNKFCQITIPINIPPYRGYVNNNKSSIGIMISIIVPNI